MNGHWPWKVEGHATTGRKGRARFGSALLIAWAAAALSPRSASAQAAAVEAAEPGEAPPSLVEDYAYPYADQIFAEYGVVVLRGDGNLELVDCFGDSSVVLVESRLLSPPDLCFRVNATPAYLELEYPNVGSIRRGATPLVAELLLGEAKVDVPLASPQWNPIAALPDQRNLPRTLLGLRTP